MEPVTDLNLITDPWIDVRRADSSTTTIAPWQITDDIDDNPIVDIVAPRPDFRSALYQFMIGLLQTCIPPKDDREWELYWSEPMKADDLKQAVYSHKNFFNVFDAQQPFMQDRRISVDACERDINELLIDAPGENGIKKNTDLFIRRDRTFPQDIQTAACTLLTMQIMAPSGGGGGDGGKKTSLRGGGPLTSILLPGTPKRTLYHSIWLNVLTVQDWNAYIPGQQHRDISEVFPWVVGMQKGGKKDPPRTIENLYKLEHFWATPRRIRLRCSNGVFFFGEKPGGTDYKEAAFLHPLSPYNNKSDGTRTCEHPQPGGFTYEGWNRWSLQKDTQAKQCSVTVKAMHASYAKQRIPAQLWLSGYDLEKAKIRCFYESEWPIIHFSDECRDDAQEIIEKMTVLADKAARTTQSQTKAAWLRRPGDHSDSTNNQSAAILADFFQQTEEQFFRFLYQLQRATQSQQGKALTLGTDWQRTLVAAAFNIFDRAVPVESIGIAHADRIAQARNDLGKYLHKKTTKTIIDEINDLCTDIHQLHMSNMQEGAVT